APAAGSAAPPELTEAQRALARALLAAGPVTAEWVGEQLARAGKLGTVIGKALEQTGYVSREALYATLIAHHRVPKLDLRAVRIPTETLGEIPEPLARAHRFLPLERVGDLLVIVGPSIHDVAAIEAIRSATGCRLALVQCPEEGFDELVEASYRRWREAQPRTREIPDAHAASLLGRRLPAQQASEAEMAASRPLGRAPRSARWSWRYGSTGPVPAVELD
ncbi:MAG: hypothetical protein D6776_00305, partial [Planctomycetota bacterium]